MDYVVPYQRKSKRDMLRKRKNRVYKRGGAFRTINFKPHEKPQQEKR